MSGLRVYRSKNSGLGLCFVTVPGLGHKRWALLGRALGHFIFPLIGLKRILFTNIFQRLDLV